jgi:hypothetical protein
MAANEGATTSSKSKAANRGLTCLSWNDCPFEPGKLAVGSSSRGVIVYTVEDSKLKEVIPFYRSFDMSHCWLNRSAFLVIKSVPSVILPGHLPWGDQSI